ncbi:alkaline phosphatase PafA [Ichthyenterobacterium sp. W332]|uniref:Alkaline phosphatase PafA n=1 Tax=Microcosmobacter mediterraneus TaxID=3075607 RepID=A0ABU2YMY7_9FLAO|nr:alkaline phosphatase PafA [Ichthyenterobacterium sp. W332]MDT0558433.1 alkaline phosphatase PafA [Ichthyenterobacterium sp. W332]
MHKLLYSTLTLLCFGLSCIAQDYRSSNNDNPKLVIGIVVDQMRYDYLTRFESKFSEDGFKRLMYKGFNCKNTHFNYIPTFTGPGHAAVFTGTTPKYNGIIGNNWYDKVEKKSVYCVNDNNYRSVGTTDDYSKVSPHRMTVTTVTDQLQLHTQQRSKVIGIALKDRGAVLPAGHSADGAYWFQGKNEGNWVTSSYYRDDLPKWVKDFNKSDKAESYFKVWNTLYDIKTYTESGPDINTYEGKFRGKDTASFPYDLDKLQAENGGFDIIKPTPFGNSLTTDFAIAALDGESMGQDNNTDFLTLSYSSTDYVGHKFGVNAKETQDTYLRLDKDLARLFKYLDTTIGVGEYTVFLTADHAAVHVPSYLKDLKIPADYYDLNAFKNKLNFFLTTTYGASDLMEDAGNFQVFLNRDKIKSLGLNLQGVQQAVVDEIISYPHIDKAYTATTMSSVEFSSGIEVLLQNGFNQKRSGDVLVVLSPSVISYSRVGTTHGSGFSYDTHVPLLFYGKGIKQGETLEKVVIPDIAPTISALLGISFPNSVTGKPLEFVLD